MKDYQRETVKRVAYVMLSLAATALIAKQMDTIRRNTTPDELPEPPPLDIRITTPRIIITHP